MNESNSSWGRSVSLFSAGENVIDNVSDDVLEVVSVKNNSKYYEVEFKNLSKGGKTEYANLDGSERYKIASDSQVNAAIRKGKTKYIIRAKDTINRNNPSNAMYILKDGKIGYSYTAHGAKEFSADEVDRYIPKNGKHTWEKVPVF